MFYLWLLCCVLFILSVWYGWFIFFIIFCFRREWIIFGFLKVNNYLKLGYKIIFIVDNLICFVLIKLLIEDKLFKMMRVFYDMLKSW